MNKAILYGFKLSSCSWRVRAALWYKGILFEERTVDIASEHCHLTDEYRKVNPAQKVPALEIDGITLVESMAILQYLEDTRPEPPLLPAAPVQRARVREIVETIVSGIQPLQNIGLRPRFATAEQYRAFCVHHTARGLQVLEALLLRESGRRCVGDALSVADLCLVPQVYNAVGRHKMKIDGYPTVYKLYSTLITEQVFSSTHPKTVVAESKL